jgi:sulfur carrier protein
MQLIINGKICTFDVSLKVVGDLVPLLKLEGKRFAIELNGEIVPRSQFLQMPLKDDDTLEIVGAVGGG